MRIRPDAVSAHALVLLACLFSSAAHAQQLTPSAAADAARFRAARAATVETDCESQLKMRRTEREEIAGLSAEEQTRRLTGIHDVQDDLESQINSLGRNTDEAKVVEGQLIALTLAQQESSSDATLQAFPKFNATLANNSQLVTTHFVTAFLPVGLRGCSDFKERLRHSRSGDADPYVNSHWYNDIGFDISSSVPISSATLADYAKQELLMRDGALLNLYASFSGRNYANQAYAWGDRRANVDRLYWVDVFDHRQPATGKQAMAFFSHGLGVRALKTQLEGTSTLGAEGTFYVGVGFDGPLFSAKAKPGTPDGMVSLELYASANVVNRNAMRTLLGSQDAPGTFGTFGANLTMYVTDRIGIQLQYASAFAHSADDSIGHVAMLTIGYNKPTGGM